MLYLLQISSPAVHLASSNHLLGKAHKKEVLIQLITPSPMRFIYRPIRIPSDNQKHLDAYIDFAYFLIFAYHLPFLVQTAKSATKVTLLWKMPDKYLIKCPTLLFFNGRIFTITYLLYRVLFICKLLLGTIDCINLLVNQAASKNISDFVNYLFIFISFFIFVQCGFNMRCKLRFS